MAVRLGQALYHRLTRPRLSVDVASPRPDADRVQIARSLAHSPAVPIRAGHTADAVDLSLAHTHLVVSIDDDKALPALPDRIPASQVRRIRLDSSLTDGDALSTTYAIAIEMLSAHSQRPGLFVCAAPDSAVAPVLKSGLSEGLQWHEAKPFRSIESATSLPSLGKSAQAEAVVIAVRDEAFGQTASCQSEIQWAKTHDVPIVEVVALVAGERRSAVSLCNVPSVHWHYNAPQILRRAAETWIQSHVFLAQAESLLKQFGLPQCTRRARPPELIDLGTLDEDAAAGNVIFHPDPELPINARRTLQGADRRVQFLTPTTAFRFIRRHEKSTDPFHRARPSPLDGSVVGISLSCPAEQALAPGLGVEHIDDAVSAIVRSLVSAGAAVGYGGDLRRAGYTHLIASIIDAYARRAPKAPKKMVSWLDAHEKEPVDDDIEYRSLASPNVEHGPAVLSPEDAKREPHSAFSDKRRLMAKGLSAAVILGGKITPRRSPVPSADAAPDYDNGYVGPFPGLLEEAWRMACEKQPIYVAGGFGGGAAAIAALALSGGVPETLTEAHWLVSGDRPADYFDQFRKSDWREPLGLPHAMEDMAAQLQTFLAGVLECDKKALAWNGLTVADNRRLMSSTDPQLVAGLILQGLTTIRRAGTGKKLAVELVQGDILQSDMLDVMSLPGVRGLPFSGAGQRVEEVLAGRMAAALQGQDTLLSLDDKRLPADWLHIAKLSNSAGSVPEFSADAAARDLVYHVHRLGLVRVGVVLYGGTIMEELDRLVEEMIKAMAALKGVATVLWFELNPSRFEAIREQLAGRWKDDIDLRVSAGEEPLGETSRSPASLLLDYDPDAKILRSYLFPPSGGPLATAKPITMDDAKWHALSKGVPYVDPDTGKVYGDPPRCYPVKEIDQRGQDVARMLFGDDYARQIGSLAGSPIEVAVDRYTSSIPIEALNGGSATPPAVAATFSRRLTVPHFVPDQATTRPMRRGRLRAVVIMSYGGYDPLPNAEREAKQVQNALARFADVTPLWTPKATVPAVLDAIADAHILHYCGHGFFVDDDPSKCGLSLDKKDLTADDLASLDHFPRLAFMSACDVGRMRTVGGSSAPVIDGKEPTSIAEYFLRNGAQAYIGANWMLGDSSAIAFCEAYYAAIQKGQTVAEAVRIGRAKLYGKSRGGDRMQWANYLLYGQGNLRLCPPA